VAREYCKSDFRLFSNLYANSRAIIDGSISVPIFSVGLRRQWLSVLPTNFSRCLPATSPRSGVRSTGTAYRCALEIYRGKLKCHEIIARSEAIKIPDSESPPPPPPPPPPPAIHTPPERSGHAIGRARIIACCFELSDRTYDELTKLQPFLSITRYPVGLF